MTPSSPSLALIKWSKPGIIYVARNRVNGKMYVGLTQTGVKRRWYSHCTAAKAKYRSALHEAIRKYGKDSFDIFVVQQCNDRICLVVAEVWWIASLQTISPNGYNITAGGESPSLPKESIEKMRSKKIGTKLTEEQKRKIGDRSRGKPRSPEVRAKISEGQKRRTDVRLAGPYHPLYGKPLAEETKRKLSAATKKRMTPEFLYMLRNLKLGTKASEETRKKMSKTHKAIVPRGKDHPWYGRIISEEERLAVSKRFKGKRHSDIWRARQSASLKGKPSGMLGKKQTPEHKRKIAESRARNKELRRN